MKQQAKDIFVGLAVTLLGGLVLWVLIPCSVVVPPSVKIATLSPAFWPKVLAGAITVFGLLIALQGFMKSNAKSENPPGTEEAKAAPEASAPPKSSKALRAGGAILGMLVYYLLVEPLGIILASVLIFPLFALLYGEKRIKILAPLAVLLPVGLYYFFTVAAHKPMPTGFLF